MLTNIAVVAILPGSCSHTQICVSTIQFGVILNLKRKDIDLLSAPPPPNISRNSSKSTRKALTDFCLFLSAKSSVTSMYRNVLLFPVGNYSSFSFFLYFVLSNSDALCRPF